MKLLFKAINKITKEEVRVTSIEIDVMGNITGFFILKGKGFPKHQTYDGNYDLILK